MRRLLKKSLALRRLYHRLRTSGQSDESRIVVELARNSPRTFVEFGFHPTEFNCSALAWDSSWRGLLIDGSPQVISEARQLLPQRLQIVESFLTLDNVDFVRTNFDRIGVLSIDVDGNDYWMLERLIDAAPSVICVEYNSTFGLKPITVPYDPAFDRHEKHASGWYHGASLTALTNLAQTFGYGLAAVSKAGGNAFFTKGDGLDPKTVWKPNTLREQYCGVGHEAQWQAIKHMPYVSV